MARAGTNLAKLPSLANDARAISIDEKYSNIHIGFPPRN